MISINSPVLVPNASGGNFWKVDGGDRKSGRFTNAGGTFQHKWNLHRALDTFFNFFKADKDAMPTAAQLSDYATKIEALCKDDAAEREFAHDSADDFIAEVKKTNEDTFKIIYEEWYNNVNKSGVTNIEASKVNTLGAMLFRRVCRYGFTLASFLNTNLKDSSGKVYLKENLTSDVTPQNTDVQKDIDLIGAFTDEYRRQRGGAAAGADYSDIRFKHITKKQTLRTMA